jgi:hypothetical protein
MLDARADLRRGCGLVAADDRNFETAVVYL